MGIRTREEILHQATELTHKQEAGLAAEHQRSAFLAAGFIPTGALVTALLASPAVNASSAQVIGAAAITLLIIITNSLCWYALHSVTKELKQGPETSLPKPLTRLQQPLPQTEVQRVPPTPQAELQPLPPVATAHQAPLQAL